MPNTCPRSSFFQLALSVESRRRVLPTVAVFVLALSACAPEEKYGTTVPVDNRNPAIDPEPTSGCPRFDSTYRDRFKSCSVDTDCEVVTYAPRCSGLRAYAVASEELEAYAECAPESPCERATAGRAEDGRSIADLEALSDVQPRCIDGMCEARVHMRVCGSAKLVCNEGEICVSLLNTRGMPEYQCTSNPCLGEVLDCSCAASVCKGGDQVRVCALDQVEDADVFCKVEGR